MQANLQQGTPLTNHYSPNRAATQVSMKYRVKRNQCQDLILNPTSSAGQVRKRTGLNEIQQADRVKRDTNQSTCPRYPPNSQDSHPVSIRYKVIPSDKRARTMPENQSAQQARYA